jgi:hypothetical protein
MTHNNNQVTGMVITSGVLLLTLLGLIQALGGLCAADHFSIRPGTGAPRSGPTACSCSGTTGSVAFASRPSLDPLISFALRASVPILNRRGGRSGDLAHKSGEPRLFSV